MQIQENYNDSNSKKVTFNKRTERDIEELQLKTFCDQTANINFYKFDQSSIELEITPLIGAFAHLKYEISILIFPSYPFTQPKIYCNNNSEHPNINLGSGQLYITCLEECNWLPTMTLNDILEQLKHTLIYCDYTIIPNNKQNINQVFFLQGESFVDDDQLSYCTDDGLKNSELVSQSKTFLENFQVDDKRDRFLEEEVSDDTDREEDPVVQKVDLSKTKSKRVFSQLEDSHQQQQDKYYFN